MRILIVDDDEPLAHMLAGQLRRLESSFEVVAVATAAAARETVRAATAPFDAFLLDHRLDASDVDGVALMQELQAASPNSDTIILTGYDDPEAGLHAFETGVYRYLMKPFDTRELVMILKSLEKVRGIRGERDWLATLADVGRELQGCVTVKDVSQIIVQAAPRLGFERARLWLFKQETQELVGRCEKGNIGLEDFDGLSISLREMPYSLRALELGKPVIYRGNELGQSALERRFGSSGFRVAIGERVKIPLLVDDRWIGVLTLDNADRPQTYTLEQRKLLQLLGNQAASALARAQNQEQVEILSDIGRVAIMKAAQGDLDGLLDEVRQQMARLMDVNSLMVTLTDPDTYLLDFRLNYDQGQLLPRQWRDPECGLVGYLIRKNEPLWFPDSKEAAFRDEHHIRMCGNMSRCWLGVPLQVDDRGTIGALVVQHYENPRQYDQSHQRLLVAIARQIAGAIDLVGQRERTIANNRRGEFLDKIRRRLPDLLQENEDWFWQLLLKFITDECGLRFNRAVIFLSDGGEALLRGRSGVGQLRAADAYHQWKEFTQRKQAHPEQICDLEQFLIDLRDRQLAARTPIEQQAPTWTLSVADEALLRIRETGRPENIPQEQRFILPQAYREELPESPSVVCVVAPMIANGRFLGMVLVDNAFNNEPARPEILASLAEILNYAAILWERWDARRRELTSAQREQFASLRAEVVQAIQRRDLRAGLQLFCEEAQGMLQTNSVVVYPLAADGVSYLKDQIRQVGLNKEIAKKDFAIRPRQHGLFAYVKRTGKVIVSNVAESGLIFDGQPLQQHDFIRKHEIRAFVGLALRSSNTGDPLGVMYLNYNTPHRFTIQEEMLAAELAEIAALALGAGRGNEEIVDQQRTQELNRLRDVLEAALSPDADDTKVISALLANAAALLPAADSVELEVLGWVDGQPVQDEKQRVYHNHRGEPTSGAEQIPLDSRQFGGEKGAYEDSAENISVLTAPVYHNKQVVGTLRVTTNAIDGFSKRDEVRIAKLASAAGLAIGSLWRRQGLLGAVLKAAEEVTRPSSFQETLQAVVDQTRKAAPELDCVTLWFHRPGSDELVAGPQWGLEHSVSREGATTQSDLVRSVMENSKPVWAPDAPNTPIFACSDFISHEKIVSTVAFPLRVKDKSVGALFLNYRQHHEFTSEERDAFPIFAAIAAASIRDAQWLEIAQRGEKRLLAALEVVRAAGTLLERDQVLRAILKSLRDHFGQYVPNASPYLLLYNADDQILELPDEAREFYSAAIGGSEPIRVRLDEPRIVSKVARRCLEEKRGVVENFPDVKRVPDYVAPDPTTCSELCAGLWRDGKNLLGVLVLKSPQLNAFTKEDEELFELVAEQVAAALERANQVAEKRVNDYLTGAMAWASDVAHDINVDVSYIRYRAYWLREREPGITAQGQQWARDIDVRAGELADKARDDSSEGIKVPVDLSNFLEKKVREWQARACPNTKINSDWGDAAMPVSVYPEQVWKSVRHLLRNAIEAMNYKGQIWLRLRQLSPSEVELLVENSGPDIPPEARQRIFREPYSSKSGGMGLLIAKRLLETMGGTISLLPAQPNRRPIFAIRLPRAQELQEGNNGSA